MIIDEFILQLPLFSFAAQQRHLYTKTAGIYPVYLKHILWNDLLSACIISSFGGNLGLTPMFIISDDE